MHLLRREAVGDSSRWFLPSKIQGTRKPAYITYQTTGERGMRVPLDEALMFQASLQNPDYPEHPSVASFQRSLVKDFLNPDQVLTVYKYTPRDVAPEIRIAGRLVSNPETIVVCTWKRSEVIPPQDKLRVNPPKFFPKLAVAFFDPTDWRQTYDRANKRVATRELLGLFSNVDNLIHFDNYLSELTFRRIFKDRMGELPPLVGLPNSYQSDNEHRLIVQALITPDPTDRNSTIVGDNPDRFKPEISHIKDLLAEVAPQLPNVPTSLYFGDKIFAAECKPKKKT